MGTPVHLNQETKLLSKAAPTTWQRWVSASVQHLQGSHLLRTLHPVSTTESPVEVLICKTTSKFETGLAH